MAACLVVSHLVDVHVDLCLQQLLLPVIRHHTAFQHLVGCRLKPDVMSIGHVRIVCVHQGANTC